MDEIQMRDFQRITDEAFVIDSWMRSFYTNSPFTIYLPRKEFQVKHLPIINRLIGKSTIRLAVEGMSPDIIVGYIVYEPEVMHYVYVKEAFRGFGIGRRLIAQCDFPSCPRVTHLTERGRQITRRLGFIYSPYFE